MGKSVEELADSCVGTLFMWGLGLYGAFWLARAAWRKIVANSGVILGGLAWVGVFVVVCIAVLVYWGTLHSRAEVRQLLAPHFKKIEENIAFQRKTLSAGQQAAKARIAAVKAELGRFQQ